MEEQSLQAIQYWFSEVLRSRGDLGQKIENAKSLNALSLPEIVKDTGNGLSAYHRLDVYASSYVLRLLEVFKAEYPILLQLMGEELFELFAKAYILTYNPQSRSLVNLCQHFPRFLAETHQKNPSDADYTLYQFPVEIARYERARMELYFAPNLSDEEEKELLMGNEGNIQGAYRLLFFDYPVFGHISAIKQGFFDFHQVYFSPNAWVLYQKNDQLKRLAKSSLTSKLFLQHEHK